MTADRRRQPRTRRRAGVAIADLQTHPHAFVGLEELAFYWNLDVQTIRKWIREGAMPGYKFGRATRVKTVDAYAFEQRAQIKAAS